MQEKETIGKTQIACWGQSNKNLLAQVSDFYFYFLVSHIAGTFFTSWATGKPIFMYGC